MKGVRLGASEAGNSASEDGVSDNGSETMNE